MRPLGRPSTPRRQDAAEPRPQSARLTADDPPPRPTAGAETPAGDGPFDAVLLLETLHDLARPVEVLAACRDALRRPGGAVLVADENVTPTSSLPVPRSSACCTAGAPATACPRRCGTALGGDRHGHPRQHGARPSLADDAGFTSTEIVDVDAGFFRLYRFTP